MGAVLGVVVGAKKLATEWRLYVGWFLVVSAIRFLGVMWFNIESPMFLLNRYGKRLPKDQIAILRKNSEFKMSKRSIISNELSQRSLPVVEPLKFKQEDNDRDDDFLESEKKDIKPKSKFNPSNQKTEKDKDYNLNLETEGNDPILPDMNSAFSTPAITRRKMKLKTDNLGKIDGKKRSDLEKIHKEMEILSSNFNITENNVEQ